MRKWCINNPFCVLLVPLILLIISCARWDWPCSLNPSVPLGVERGDTTRHYYSVAMLSEANERRSSYRYEARVLSGLATMPRVYLYFQKDSTCMLPKRGDTLLVYTCFQQPDSLFNLDYAAYLHKQGISGTGYVPRWAWQLVAGNRQPWYKSSMGWQQRLIRRYEDLGIHGRELGTVSALTLGYREDLDDDLRQQFSAAGAMHVLAVSGLHTGILMQVLMNLLTFFGLRKPLYEERFKRIALGCTMMVLLVGYALLTGCTPSVVRSVVMCCLLLLAMMTNRRAQMMNSVFAAAFLILIFRPTDLFAVSFQLSFAAVIAIALFGQGWSNLFALSWSVGSNKLFFQIKRYLLGVVGMSLAAMIGTMPISLFYFGQISNYFMLSNLIVLPLAWLMMVGGLFVLTIGWWTPLGTVLAMALNGVTKVMNAGVGWVESLSGATTQVVLSKPMLWGLVLVNLSILIMWQWCTTQRLKWK